MNPTTSSLIRLAVAALLLGGLDADVAAQPSVNAVLGGTFDSLDRTAAAASDSAAPSGSVALEQLAFVQRLRLFYSLDGGTFTTEGDWHYLQHGGGGRYRIALGGKAGLFVGATGTLRVNGDSWSTANYKALGAFSNLDMPVLARDDSRRGACRPAHLRRPA